LALAHDAGLDEAGIDAEDGDVVKRRISFEATLEFRTVEMTY